MTASTTLPAAAKEASLSRLSSVERVMVASLLVMVGSSSMPMDMTCAALNTSSATAAISGRARCFRHQSRLWAYLS